MIYPSGRRAFGSQIIVARDSAFVTFSTIEEAISDATRLAAVAAFGSPDFVVYELLEHRRKLCGTAPMGAPPSPPKRGA